MAQNRNPIKRYEDALYYDPLTESVNGKDRKTPPIKIPLIITLRDGRTFDTIFLLMAVTTSKSITLKVRVIDNIKTPRNWEDFMKKEPNPDEKRGALIKHDAEMRRWISLSSVDDVMTKLEVTYEHSRKLIKIYRAELNLSPIKRLVPIRN